MRCRHASSPPESHPPTPDSRGPLPDEHAAVESPRPGDRDPARRAQRAVEQAESYLRARRRRLRRERGREG